VEERVASEWAPRACALPNRGRPPEKQPRDSVQSVMSATSPGSRKAADLAESKIGTMSPKLVPNLPSAVRPGSGTATPG